MLKISLKKLVKAKTDTNLFYRPDKDTTKTERRREARKFDACAPLFAFGDSGQRRRQVQQSGVDCAPMGWSVMTWREIKWRVLAHFERGGVAIVLM